VGHDQREPEDGFEPCGAIVEAKVVTDRRSLTVSSASRGFGIVGDVDEPEAAAIGVRSRRRSVTTFASTIAPHGSNAVFRLSLVVAHASRRRTLSTHVSVLLLAGAHLSHHRPAVTPGTVPAPRGTQDETMPLAPGEGTEAYRMPEESVRSLSNRIDAPRTGSNARGPLRDERALFIRTRAK